MWSRDAIFGHLSDCLVEMFEIPQQKISWDARLFEDLDLDSIDAVDLVVRLQELTGRRIKPDAFKAVRTVGDVVTCVETVLATDAPLQT